MTITRFIKRDFLTIQAYAATSKIKTILRDHYAIVVQDEQLNTLGVLTLSDIVVNNRNLVVDCFTAKPALPADCSVEDALRILDVEKAEVLPVFEHERLVGLLFRHDLLQTVKRALEDKISECHELLKQVSWIQSHETRQPVATILGLISIVNKSSLSEENLKIFGMLEKTVIQLDTIIRSTVVKVNSAEFESLPNRSGTD